MKTVVHIIDSEEPGGAEKVFLDLICSIDSKKYYNVVIVPGGGWLSEQLNALKIPFKTLPCKGSFNLKYALRLYLLLKAVKADIIHSHLLGSNVYSSLVGFLSQIPVISTFHGAVDISPEERFLGLKSALIRRGSSKIIAVSKSLKNEIVHRLKLLPSSVSVIYNGVNTREYTPEKDLSFRKTLGIGDTDTLVSSIGHLRPAKDYETLIDAAKLLKDSGEIFYFAIAGDTSGSYYRKLVHKIQAANLGDRVFLVGNLERPIELLRASDIFLLSSQTEGFSISTIEAMAAGIPVIATKSGGPEEIIEHNVTGLLVSIQAPNEIKDAVHRLQDKVLQYSLATNARECVVDKFSAKIMLEQYTQLYAQLAK